MRQFKVAILGTGNIGTDLLIKVQRSPYLKCVAFVGRNSNSPGIAKAMTMGVTCSDNSINYIAQNHENIDLVFDATSAKDHLHHAPIFRKLGIIAVDLTPAKVGVMAVPAANMSDCLEADNINMITCGGQASIPIAYAIGLSQSNVEYIETVSSISSKSAGPATRRNLDEYIQTTEKGLIDFSGAKLAKAIINLNPAIPCINMQTTVFAKIENPDMESLQKAVNKIVDKIQSYVPGYELIVPPFYENGRVAIMVRVRGLGDYLPEYAGNLDIINCAAIAMAEEYAKKDGEK